MTLAFQHLLILCDPVSHYVLLKAVLWFPACSAWSWPTNRGGCLSSCTRTGALTIPAQTLTCRLRKRSSGVLLSAFTRLYCTLHDTLSSPTASGCKVLFRRELARGKSGVVTALISLQVCLQGAGASTAGIPAERVHRRQLGLCQALLGRGRCTLPTCDRAPGCKVQQGSPVPPECGSHEADLQAYVCKVHQLALCKYLNRLSGG